jgi:multiple sugar transport system substrate-binding protein
MRSHRSVAVTAVVMTLLCASLTSCGNDPLADDPRHIKVWSLENLTDRFARTQQIMKDFTARTGITVDLQGVDESQLPQLIVQGAAAGTLPDVIGGLPLALVRQLDSQEVIDPGAAGAVVKELGADTFAASALELTRDGDRQLAVPSDAWSQILVYRKDLFEAAGLAPPTDYEKLWDAATKLTKDGRAGITLATDPADVFTSQTFESLALGNDCQLVDSDEKVTLDSPQCRATFELYQKLATQTAPKGTQTVDSTRESYFAGQSAMVLWSTFLLDELAGLRNDALPTCPQCKADPQFLSRNSGVITSVRGPDGQDADGFGEVTSWVAVAAGKTASAQRLMSYMMTDGYAGWLGLAPEGKFPVRSGDAQDPKKYTAAWTKLPAGVDTRKPLSQVYDAETIDQISAVTGSIDRWAIPQGQGDLLGSVSSQLPIAKVIAEMVASKGSPTEAAASAQDEVTDLQEDLS